MRLVIADTSSINYLLLIGYIDILPALFEKVIVPAAVCEELKHPKAPAFVRNWAGNPAAWVEVRPARGRHDASLEALDEGEEAAILLALELHADLLLMDDEEGVIAARGKGLEVTGRSVPSARRRNANCWTSARPSSASSEGISAFHRESWTGFSRSRRVASRFAHSSSRN